MLSTLLKTKRMPSPTTRIRATWQMPELKLRIKLSGLGSRNMILFSQRIIDKCKLRIRRCSNMRLRFLDRSIGLLRRRGIRLTTRQGMSFSLNLGEFFACCCADMWKVYILMIDLFVDRYNMPVYTNPYLVTVSPWAQRELSDGILYKPSYTLGNAFEESCDAWFNDTSSACTTYRWNMKKVNGHDWSDLEHSSSVTSLGGSAFCLLSASKSTSTEETVFNGWSQGFGESVSLELSMKGSPLVFNLGAGYWYDPCPLGTSTQVFLLGSVEEEWKADRQTGRSAAYAPPIQTSSTAAPTRSRTVYVSKNCSSPTKSGSKSPSTKPRPGTPSTSSCKMRRAVRVRVSISGVYILGLGGVRVVRGTLVRCSSKMMGLVELLLSRRVPRGLRICWGRWGRLFRWDM